jgi:HAD superfamily hydrolase (TIGR01509 family)
VPRTRPAAVLWDMDGTLIDTEPYWMASERDLVADFGGTWSEEHARAIVGFDLLDAARYITANSPVDLAPAEIVERLLDGVISRLALGIPWRPGARELLEELHHLGIPCALVTMSWRRFVEPVLAQLPPDTFAAVVTGDEVTLGKPDPEPYLRAAALLGVSADQCVAIEDSPTGVASALAAQCAVVGVPNVRDIEDQPGVWIRDSLTQVSAQDLASLRRKDLGPQDVNRDDRGLNVIRHARSRRPPVLLALGVLAAVAIGIGLVRELRADLGGPPAAIELDVWAPYWTLSNSAPELSTRIRHIREVSPFWFRATGVTSIETDPNVNRALAEQFMEVARRSGAAVVPSVVDALPAGQMASILADPTSRQRHIDALVRFTLEGDYDGLDIDYEQFAFADGRSTWETTRPNWVAFITELAAELHERDLILTVSIPPVYDAQRTSMSGYWVYDHGAIAEVVDRIRLMVYDYSTSRVGPIAPFDFVQRSIQGTLSVVRDPSRLVLGIPAYGYNWPISVSGDCPGPVEGRTTVTTRSIHDLLARRGGTPEYQPLTGEWNLTYDLEYREGDQSCVQTRQVIYVDGDGLADRIMMAREAGLGGVALWALGYEDDPVWDQIVAAISAVELND